MDTNLLKLEYNKILEILSTYSTTYIGKEYIQNLRPSSNKEIVQKNLDETNEGIFLIQRNSTPPICEFANVTIYLKSLESSAPLGIKALLELKNILEIANNLKYYFNQEYLDKDDFQNLNIYFENLYTNANIVKILTQSIIDENNISDTASSKLYKIRKNIQDLESNIRSKLNQIIHSSNYSKYIQENIITIRDNRFVIPVKEENRNDIKGFIHDISSSGSTVFIEPISIFDMNNELTNLHIEENIEIEKILQHLSSLLAPYSKNIANNIEIIGKLDFIFAKASYSLAKKCTAPKINEKKQIFLKNARHPLIDNSYVVPISIELGKNFSNLVITGPNAGGKTVTLKTIGLISAMACSGLNIPADSNSSIYIFDQIFADIGDEQSISKSLSTFSAQIKNIVNITNTATSNSLILLDELGSGTDPLEGANLAISILEYFTKLGALTVSTSHYQELKKYALTHSNFKNASVEFDVENLQPTYRLLIGIPGKSNAFAISKKLGLSDDIILFASSMLDKDAIYFEDILKNIYNDKAQIENEKQKTKLALEEAENLKSSLKKKNQELLDNEKKLIENAKFEAKQILLDAKETANTIIKELSNNTSNSKANKLRTNLNEQISKLNITKEPQINSTPTLQKDIIVPGLSVFITNFNSDGIILSKISKDNTVQVQIGSVKTTVSIEELKPSKKIPANKNSYYTNHSSSKSMLINSELNIIGLSVDEAIPIIDKYLDDCFIAKLSPIRIIHGKGTGTLRKRCSCIFKK